MLKSHQKICLMNPNRGPTFLLTGPIDQGGVVYGSYPRVRAYCSDCLFHLETIQSQKLAKIGGSVQDLAREYLVAFDIMQGEICPLCIVKNSIELLYARYSKDDILEQPT